ncbi:GntR family transcriptional regulator [Silicimonas algicola]|uniref:DNA-binding GntR family transcriptional regulator n=1 Tax=Silicimonas algicola TaxID=1826607 RepID=A0A316FVF5_9RHOB|nr:GntR family transcriptional regulator [Silicimonas algicola]AZQ68315.1 GntR family transcriptional regulator [Silicimonas algicola]PWK52711.1 DNA-binding GntR family transcriptional regulator [Silicimonas algicola]
MKAVRNSISAPRNDMFKSLLVSWNDSADKMTPAVSKQCAAGVVENALNRGEPRPSLVAQIAVDVGADIIEGDYAPGADLNSVDLSQRYTTSRTPVREALLLLEKEGLVTIPPRRRPRVVQFDVHDVREIYRTRCALLEFIASDVARKATDEDIARLEAIACQMATFHERGDNSAYLWSNVGFHDLNTDLSGNRTVKRIIDSLLLRTLPLRRLSLSTPEAIRLSLEDHQLLVRAYKSRDSNLAAAILRSNHMRSLARIEMRLAQYAVGEASLMAAAQVP